MKQAIVELPFLINKNNQELLLDGKIINNLDDIPSMIIKMMNIHKPLYVYEIRPLNDPRSQYPTQDVILGNVIGVNIENKDNPKLKISLSNTLLYTINSSSDPVVRINGYEESDDNGNITITEITRISVGPRNLEVKYIE